MPIAAAPAVAVAAALTAALAALPEATANPPTLTAARYWRPPPLTREALAGQPPAAMVLPSADTETRAARAIWTREITLDLVLVAPIADPTPATVDPLLALAEICCTTARTLTDAAGLTWHQTTRETIALADPDTLTRGAWFYVARLTYAT